MRPGNTTVSETDNVPLGAVAEGNPAPHVAWVFRKELVLQNKSGDFNYTITNIKRNESGTYQCIATNHVGKDMKEFVITVECKSSIYKKPVLLSVPLGILLQNEKDIVCKGNGKETIKTIGIITATHIHLLQAFDWCRVFISVPVRVVLSAEGANVTVVEGSNVTLPCTAEGNPTPHVAWIAPNGTVLQNRTTDTNLMLKSVSRHCRGSYQCVAANELGSTTVKVNLVVWCK